MLGFTLGHLLLLLSSPIEISLANTRYDGSLQFQQFNTIKPNFSNLLMHVRRSQTTRFFRKCTYISQFDFLGVLKINCNIRKEIYIYLKKVTVKYILFVTCKYDCNVRNNPTLNWIPYNFLLLMSQHISLNLCILFIVVL